MFVGVALRQPKILLALCLSIAVVGVAAAAADEAVLPDLTRKGYSKGDVVPITDDHGNLQYIPFITCKENGSPLAFTFNQPTTQNCTLDAISDDLYHLLQYFVHSDVPLSCRVPSYPLSQHTNSLLSSTDTSANDYEKWTPFTIALQGTLQKSHLHLHTNINALFHIVPNTNSDTSSHLIASTAYSLPSVSQSSVIFSEGAKILPNEPLTLTFNVGWIEGAVLPGMVGRPMKVTDHSVGFSLLSFFAVIGAAGTGALLMLVYERRKSGRAGMNGLLGGNSGSGIVVGGAGRGYGGYGGYGGYSGTGGKKD